MRTHFHAILTRILFPTKIDEERVSDTSAAEEERARKEDESDEGNWQSDKVMTAMMTAWGLGLGMMW